MKGFENVSNVFAHNCKEIFFLKVLTLEETVKDCSEDFKSNIYIKKLSLCHKL